MVEPNVQIVAKLLREGMAEGKTSYLTVSSNSMLPLLRTGDQVAIQHTPAVRLEQGDIIVLQGDRSLTTHRYWGTHKRNGQSWLLTKGDRPLANDPLWPIECYMGKVVRRRRSGHVLNLDSGLGNWLNRWLTSYVALEARLFSGSLPTYNDAPAESADSRYILNINQEHSLPKRIIRRASLAFATLLVMIVDGILSVQQRGKMRNYRNILFATLIILLTTMIVLSSSRVQASADLSDFRAESNETSIKLIWVTTSELDNLGFNVWRGNDCDPAVATQLNDNLIPSQVEGQASGATYEFDDADVEQEITYDYRLESLDTAGNTECHHNFPLQATAGDGDVVATPTSDNSSTPPPTSTNGTPDLTGTPADITNTPELTATSNLTGTLELTGTPDSTGTSNLTSTPESSPDSNLEPTATDEEVEPATEPPGDLPSGQTVPTPSPMASPGSGRPTAPNIDSTSVITDPNQTMSSEITSSPPVTTTVTITQEVAVVGNNNLDTTTTTEEATAPLMAEGIELEVVGEGSRLDLRTKQNFDQELSGEEDNRLQTIAIMILLVGSAFLMSGILAFWFVYKRQQTG